MKILLPAKLNSTGTILIMEDTTQNTCRYCGKSLPEEAIFCYYCRRELVTRPERPASETAPLRLKPWIIAVIVIIVVVIVVVVVIGG